MKSPNVICKRDCIMEAIILAGGLGTRLRSVISDVPKPMAPIRDDGTPFLACLISYLEHRGFEHIVLSVGYLGEVIKEYFGEKYSGVKIDYSEETKPLLTGGAIKQALHICKEDNVFVLNGDTFFDVDYCDMLHKHKKQNVKITVAVKKMHDFDRYGTVNLKDDIIKSFTEKQYCKYGWINGGVYCMDKTILDNEHKSIFSFEKDILEKYVMDIEIRAYKSTGKFVDIGVPEDYFKVAKGQKLFCF